MKFELCWVDGIAVALWCPQGKLRLSWKGKQRAWKSWVKFQQAHWGQTVERLKKNSVRVYLNTLIYNWRYAVIAQFQLVIAFFFKKNPSVSADMGFPSDKAEHELQFLFYLISGRKCETFALWMAAAQWGNWICKLMLFAVLICFSILERKCAINRKFSQAADWFNDWQYWANKM